MPFVPICPPVPFSNPVGTPVIVSVPGPDKVVSAISRSCPVSAKVLPVLVPRINDPLIWVSVPDASPDVYVLPSLRVIAPFVVPSKVAVDPGAVSITPAFDVFNVPP